jgi:hypothetical protein
MNTIIIKKNQIRHTLKRPHLYKNRVVISVFTVIILTSLSGIFPKNVIGNTVSDENYSIDVNTIDTNPQPTTPPPIPPVRQVLGTTTYNYVPNYFTTGPNYKVTTSNASLTFESSENLIDYGILSSTNPVIRNSQLSLFSPELGGQILSYEDNPLSTTTNDSVQNTTCDNGSCSPDIAAPWINTLTYGFGYRCDNQDKKACDTQFSDNTYYKSYSIDSENQTPAAIVTSTNEMPDTKATITYKVNISGTQKTGGYDNNLTYLAIPNF